MKRTTLFVLIVALLVLGSVVTACKPAASTEEFVFGVVLVGPYNDHGYSEAHYQGAKYAETKIPGARMVYLDKLNSADRPGTTLEQVVEEMVAEGAKLIITTSDDFGADTDVVAAKYPDLPFVHMSGDNVLTGEAPDNVANFFSKMEYTKAIAGCAAALATETGEVGYLGPLINDETRRLASSAYLGCRECWETYRGGDPEDLRFVVNWIGFWFNIPGVTLDPTVVANDLFNSGVDVLMSGIDTTEAIVVAGQRMDKGEKVWAIPYDYEGACEIKPEVCLGTPYFNWGPVYVEIINKVLDDKFEHEFVWHDPYWKDLSDEDKSYVGFKYGPALTEDQQKDLEDYIDKLADGKTKFFVGPLNLQDGTAYLADGEKATDEQIWYLPQLLEGMEGASQ